MSQTKYRTEENGFNLTEGSYLGYSKSGDSKGNEPSSHYILSSVNVNVPYREL